MKIGDRLFLYTDGIIEAAAPDHNIGTDGLKNELKTTLNLDVDKQVAMILELLKDVCDWAATKPSDDMTLIGLEVMPESFGQSAHSGPACPYGGCLQLHESYRTSRLSS